MDHLALIGVSHRRGGANTIEAYQEAYQGDRLEHLRELGLAEYVAIVTCNRWDVVLTVPDGVSVEEVRRRLTPPGCTHPYAYVADGALEQLTRVAASLDALNPGEDQIMRQVRNAYTTAQRDGTTGPTTSFAFETALRAAKRVRREVALAPVRTSLFSLARPSLLDVLSPGTSVVILGSGEMGSLAAKGLATLTGVRVVVVSRDVQHAVRVARPLGHEAMSLASFLARPPDVDALVAATPVRNLVDATVLGAMPALRLAVDLGLPRNVDGASARRQAVRVLDVDSLRQAGIERRDAMAERFAAADNVVREEIEEAMAAWTERSIGPAIQRLRALYLATLGETLPADDASKLAHRFAHVPIGGLRALAREYGGGAASTFLTGAGLTGSGVADVGPTEPGSTRSGPTRSKTTASGRTASGLTGDDAPTMARLQP